LNNLWLFRSVKYQRKTSVAPAQHCNCGRQKPSTEKATNCDRRAGTQGCRTSLAVMQQQQGAIMKLATLGLVTALAFTSSYALAQSGAGSAGGSSATGSAATSGATTGSPATGTTTGNAMGNPGAGMSNSAGSAAAGANSGRNPSGNTLINPSPSGSTLTPTPGGR
jgi:hypothetical protein